MAPRPYVILGGIGLVIVAFVGYRTFITMAVEKDMTNVGIVSSEPKDAKTPASAQPGATLEKPSPKPLEIAKAPTDKAQPRAPEVKTNVEHLEKPAAPSKQEVQTKFDPLEWTAPKVPEEIANVDQNDPRLIRHIKEQWILPPFTGPRNLENPNRVHYSQRGQSEYIDQLLKQKTNGFYIECGAAHGEGLSNSLFFEKTRNWTGILIEANPDYFKNILKIKRHAYMMRACLSPNPKPEVLDFRMAGYIGGLIEHMEPGHKARVIHENGEADPVKVQCFPLLSILKALNITHVDYFSLDIEGAEYEILKDFPFDEIKVDVLTIEYVVSGGGPVTQQKLKKITDLMIGRYGYKKTSYRGAEDIMLSKGV